MQFSRPLLLLTSILILSFVSGCANLNSIYRSDGLSSSHPTLVSVDARQRSIIANPYQIDLDGKVQKLYFRFCAEPSPDVFTAIAGSLGAKASAVLGATGDKDINAEFASTLSENAATIERSQTINILRETMYRTCERFLSGAINKDEFIVQTARDQRAMVATLAIEQITGVSRAQSTALTTIAKSSTQGSTDASIAALTKAKNDFETTKKSSESLTKDATDAAPKDTTCADFDAANHTNKDEATKKLEACKLADEAAKAHQSASEYFEMVKGAIKNQSAVSSETLGKLSTAVLQVGESSQYIANKVVEIVKENNEFDELLMTCVVLLRNDKTDANESLQRACITLVEQMAQTEAAELKSKEQMYRELNTLAPTDRHDRYHETILNYVTDNGLSKVSDFINLCEESIAKKDCAVLNSLKRGNGSINTRKINNLPKSLLRDLFLLINSKLGS